MPSYSDSGPSSSSSQPESRPRELVVLYEDNHLIAVFKPSGVLVQGDNTGATSLMDITKAWLKAKYQKPGNVFLGLVHRLDRPVSGIVLFAKTSKGASRLSEQFRNRSVKKTYWAVVQGTPMSREASLQNYLSESENGKILVVEESSPGSKLAKLHYRTLLSQAGLSLLEIHLETGRKHQIRVQLSYLGHPILGDQKYGSSRGNRDEIALLAERLEFAHPVRAEERLVIELTPPLRDLSRWLNVG